MRKIILVVAVMLVFASGAFAQAPAKPFDVFLGGGVGFPSSPSMFSDGWKMGFHGLGGLDINLPMLKITGKAEYHTFPFDWGDADGSGLALRALMIGADVKYAFGVPAAPAKPFVMGGLGMANVTFSDLESGAMTVSFEDETKLYFEIGGGVEFNKFFGMIRYVNIATSGESTAFIPISVGIKF